MPRSTRISEHKPTLVSVGSTRSAQGGPHALSDGRSPVPEQLCTHPDDAPAPLPVGHILVDFQRALPRRPARHPLCHQQSQPRHICDHGARIICGHASSEFSALAAEYGLALLEYEEDMDGRVARAPAIAEGAVARIVTETTSTIHGARIAVLGFGVIAEHVAAALAALHGEVTVFARSEAQQSSARTANHAVESLASLAGKLAEFDLIVSAIPAPVLSAELLKAVPPTTTIFDLASPPGSVDHVAGAALGKKVVWARGLGATSPVSVGRAQWTLIERLLRS